MPDVELERIASQSLELYKSLKFTPPARQYSILASFLLSKPDLQLKVISLATGSKCLPAARLPKLGDALHDSHAEVLARRGAIRWFMDELGRQPSAGSSTPFSEWLCKREGGLYGLRENVRVHMYVSTVPCGDASMRFLASDQDEEMAALKSSAVFPPLAPDTPARGRDNYALFGVLRTKPGRADSPRTLCMSCSDKIAAWSVLGFQGALASRLLEPIYVDTVVIGDVPIEMYDIVREDCDRAFGGRLQNLPALPLKFYRRKPSVYFTTLPFPHSKSALVRSVSSPTSCNESICWIADSNSSPEILINGVKRGLSPKHRHLEKHRPGLCKISLFGLYNAITAHLGMTPDLLGETYFTAKKAAVEYQAAKLALKGDGGPFAAWVTSGEDWESFSVDGQVQSISAKSVQPPPITVQ